MAHQVVRIASDTGAQQTTIRFDDRELHPIELECPPQHRPRRCAARISWSRDRNIRGPPSWNWYCHRCRLERVAIELRRRAVPIVLRPFKVGDIVSAGGITGSVESIGLFGTTFHTPDHVVTIVGNSKIFAYTIQNFSANDYRRVDLQAQISHSTDHQAAIRVLKEGLQRIPNVLATPAPVIEILQFNLAGPLLAIRPFCSNEHYWQVYFDTNRLIRETFQQAGFSVPEQHYSVRGVLDSAGNARGLGTAA